MNYRELLDVAEYNREESGFKAPTKPPNKKLQKSNVQSDGVRRFLEKKKAEEAARAAEARKQKEKLLALRAQSSKNNKKAKIMASRTKDNDFSRIRLTEDEIESKKKIEVELQRKHLADKVERMKVRIEMEEKEKLLPRKRKRKSKVNGVEVDVPTEEHIEEEVQERPKSKPKPRPPPPTSYHDLLKLAEMKKNEPIVIPKKKKEEDRPLSKRERKLYEEEQERERRKRERLEKGASLNDYKIPTAVKHSSIQDKKSLPEKTNLKKPLVVHVGKNSVTDNNFKFKNSTTNDNSKIKNSKSSTLSDKKALPKTIEKSKEPVHISSKAPLAPKSFTNHNREIISKNVIQNEKVKLKPSFKDDNVHSSKKQLTEKVVQKKKSAKITPVVAPPVPPPAPQLDTEALAAVIASKIKKDLEKEIEAKYAAKFASLMPKSNESDRPKVPEKIKSSSSGNKVHPSVNGTVAHKSHGPPAISKKDPERMMNAKPQMKAPKPPPPPTKKPFHINPYLDPPRRRLEPVRPQRPPIKRRIESDDEDDDMSDFIDDGPSQNDEDYSKYIKEIFGYDRSRYLDEDDEDIVETSFAEQMKEEVRSAKLGFLEDLEEERKNRELEKKWKQKHKK